MGALVGFIFGYVVGVKTGPDGLENLRRAWQDVSSSEEFQGMVAAGLDFARGMLAQAGAPVAAQLEALASGKSEALAGLGDPATLGTAWKQISESHEFQALLAGGTQFVGSLLAQGTAALSGERPEAR